MSTVRSGTTPIGSGASDAAINAIDKGAELKIIAAGQESVLAVLGSPDVSSFEQLRRKKVALSSLGAGSSLVFSKVLEHHKLDLNRDVKPVLSQSTPQRVAALESGAVGATIAGPPDVFVPLAKGAHLIEYTQKTVPFLFICHFVKASFAQENPEVVRAYVRAVSQAHRWMTDPANQKAAEKILQDYTKIDAATIHRTYEVVFNELRAIPSDATFTVADMASGACPGCAARRSRPWPA